MWLACRDPRLPWYVRVLALCVVAYAFSPFDLIPDFIPILGYLDDLILVPAGIALCIKLIPRALMQEYRKKAEEWIGRPKPVSYLGAGLMVLIWLVLLGWLGNIAYHHIAHR